MEPKNPNSRIKILALCDSPTSSTGFAQVSKNILRRLARTGRYEIDIIGINYRGDFYDREKHPYAIYPAQPQGYEDMYGRKRLLSAIAGNESKSGLKPPWDILFTIQDPFIIEGLGLNIPLGDQLRVVTEMWKRSLPPDSWFKWVAYWPIDAAVKENWVTRAIALPNVPVAYCDWGKEQAMRFDRDKFKVTFNLDIKESGDKKKAMITVPSMKDRMEVIHHGVDLNVFKPLHSKVIKEFRKKYFGGLVKDDTYLVVNISRNQPRKDIQRTIAVFAGFKKRVKNAFLYLHMKPNDLGGSVDEMCRNYGLIPNEDYTVPDQFDAGNGLPIETVNMIYNAADLCMTTTLGEGWGFITSESMATKTPLVAPNITALLDIFNSRDYDGSVNGLGESNKLRGIPVKAGTTSSEWVCLGLEDNERIRPLTNVDDMIEKMFWAYKNPDKVKEIVERAYEWVQGQNWDDIAKKWDTLFQRVYGQLQEERELGKRIDNASRNEPCPCGSGKKFKKCHGNKDMTGKWDDWLQAAQEEIKNNAQPKQ